MYEQGWNKLTQAHYAQSEWPEAETIAPLVGNGALLQPQPARADGQTKCF
jgi:hypothetical protein